MNYKKVLHTKSVRSANIILVLILCLILVDSKLIFGQSRDNELWTGIELEIPITKKFALSYEQEFRLNENMGMHDWTISDLGMAYKLNSDIKFSFSYNYRSGEDKWQHVLNGNFYYDEKIQKIKIIYRLRYQKKYKYKFEWNNEGEKRIEDSYEDHIRNRLILEYDTDTWIKPYMGFELFYLIDNLGYQTKIKQKGPDLIVQDRYSDRFDVYRFYLGLKMDTFKDQSLGVYWMYEEEFNIDEPQIANVIGINYSFELPRWF